MVWPVAAYWSDLVTISNCGGSDADNICGAGTMTKTEGPGWNNRVWDDQPCCWNCDCNGARWKQVGAYAYGGFSAWNSVSGGTRCSATQEEWEQCPATNKDGNNRMNSYALYQSRQNNDNLNVGWLEGDWPDTGDSFKPGPPWDLWMPDTTDHVFEVRLTETGADMILDDLLVYSIAQEPVDSQYRFGYATNVQNSGYTDLQYHFGSY